MSPARLATRRLPSPLLMHSTPPGHPLLDRNIPWPDLVRVVPRVGREVGFTTDHMRTTTTLLQVTVALEVATTRQATVSREATTHQLTAGQAETVLRHPVGLEATTRPAIAGRK